jgi:hypothetical protein
MEGAKSTEREEEQCADGANITLNKRDGEAPVDPACDRSTRKKPHLSQEEAVEIFECGVDAFMRGVQAHPELSALALTVTVNAFFCVVFAGLGILGAVTGSWALLLSLATFPAALAAGFCWMLAWKSRGAMKRPALVLFLLLSLAMIGEGFVFADASRSGMPLVICIPGLCNLVYFYREWNRK